MQMKWGPLGNSFKGGIVFFAGKSDSTLVGLGGSMKHVLGHEGISTYQSLSGSSLRSIGMILERLLRIATLAKDEIMLPEKEIAVDQAVEQAFDFHLDGPSQELEFTAKKLYADSSVLVASPLYVSLVD